MKAVKGKKHRRFRIHRQRRTIRKIYISNFTLLFVFLTLVLAGMIYLLGANRLLENLLHSSAFSVFTISTVCLLAAFLLAYYMLHELFRTIDRLDQATRLVARGDYTVQLESDTMIAEIQDMEESFNQMVQELNSVEMLRQNFIADVSHEFRTPLSSITGYITLLQDPELSEEERTEYTKMAIFNAEKLNDLTDNILRISRLENQTSLPDPVSYRLDEQIREAMVLLEPKWSAKNIQLDINLAEIQYTGQKDLLFQVWLNLIGNAIKFSEEGGLIHLQLYRQPGNAADDITRNAVGGKDTICVSVRDEGIGMEPETRARIFEKFYQGDTSRRSQGNGLGLALCREIINRCEGRIQVESQPGSGSTFTVYLR